MLNKAHFHELATALSRNLPPHCPWKPMELLIRDNIGNILEAKIKACMGGFGFLKRRFTNETVNADLEVNFFNFTVGHPEYRAQMQCSFYDENMLGAQFEFQVTPWFMLMVINTAPLPDHGGGRKEETEEDKRQARREQQRGPDRLRAEDFDPAALNMFIELLGTVTTDVMMKAIPERKASVSKHFKEGAMVYRLTNPDKVTAAHVIEITGVNTVTADNEVCDMGVYEIAEQKSRWVHSSNFGTELEWIKAMKGFTNGGQRPAEYAGATDAEIDYIQGALVRIGAILRG
jgi:hypothetical protein